LTGPGFWTAGVTVALVAALGLVAYRLRQRQARTMEIVTLAYFVAHFIATVALGLPIFKIYGALFNNLALALMAFGSLLARSPFTYEYAREDYPRELWEHPMFRLINQIITGVWGGIFALNLALGAFALAIPGAAFGLNVIAANIGVIAGIIFSSAFPGWFMRYGIARQIAARDPWPSPTFDAPRPASAHEHDVIIIGAGIGGLTAGALLAQRGLNVIVFEQHFLAGGYCTSWERGVRRGDQRLRYVFDAGVHDVSGLGERGTVRNLMRQLDIEEEVDWRRMDHEYFLDDIHLKIPRDPDEFVAALGKIFPAEKENARAFFAEMRAILREMYADVEKTGGAPAAPRTVEETLAWPPNHPHAFKWMDQPFGKMLDTFITDARLKELLSALTGYLSDDPTALTVGAMAPIIGYYFEGGYYPGGGSQKFADALVAVIEKNRGQVRLRTGINRILIENGRAVGVELANGATHRARAILSNADARATFLELVGREHLTRDFARQIESLQPATSAFEVFLGVDFVPNVEPITMVGANGAGVGICIPSKVDASLAPPGHSSIVLIKLVSQPDATTWDRKAPDYRARKKQCADELIALAERAIPGLRAHIVYRDEATPATMARYTWSSGGAIYGPALKQWRGQAKSPIERLYLAGAGADPGAGIEAVVISGMWAADAIYSDS
jgi:phytoene dehydrogenase-like protein